MDARNVAAGAEERAAVEERLRAYMHPNRAQTPEQQAALERAVDAQLAFERDGGAGLPPGVAAMTVGNYSVRLAEPGGAAPSQSNLCPAAWAILFNAGLLKRALPVAQRL